MVRIGVIATAVVLALTGSSWAIGFPQMTVTPSLAPNAYGSPSFAGYQANAMYALEHGLSSYGDPTLPTYYQAAPATLLVSQNIVTGFASWNGLANPTGAFASELGNRLTFGLHILGNGTRFSISQLSFVGISTDPTNSLGFSYAGGYAYSAAYVGIDYVDGIKGNGNDVLVTSGSTQLVDELVGRGSGNAWAAYLTDLGGTTPQDKIDNAVAGVGATPFDFTGTYTLNLATGQPLSAEGKVTFVPEPLTMLSVFGGLTGVAAYIRRRMTV